MRIWAMIVFFVMALSVFSVSVSAGSAGSAYTLISKSDGYLAGTIVANGSFIIAGSNHVWKYENDTFTMEYENDSYVITDIKGDGTHIFLVMAELYERYSGTVYNENGDSGGESHEYPSNPTNSTNDSGNNTVIVQSAPDPPSQVTADYDSSSAAVQIGWYAPSNDGNSSILRYNIYRGQSQTQLSLLATVDASASSSGVYSYSDTDVSAGNTYYYYVTAVNSIGESNPSNEVYVYISSGGSSGGINPDIATSPTTTVHEDAGYNATNFTIVELSSDFQVLNTYRLSGLTIYAGGLQLPRLAHMLIAAGKEYLIITGEYTNNTQNAETEIYQLSGGSFTHVKTLNDFITAEAADSSHIYLISYADAIYEYDTSFNLITSNGNIAGAGEHYNDIVAQDGKLYLAGSTVEQSGKSVAAYYVVESDLTTVDRFIAFNQTGSFAALTEWNGTVSFVDTGGALYEFNDPYAVYAGGTSMKYVKSLITGQYYDLSGDFTRVLYAKMYEDSQTNTTHYVLGGFAQTWSGQMYLFITLTDRPVNWEDYAQAGAWLIAAGDMTSPAWWALYGAFVAVLGGIVYYERKRRR